MHQEERRAEKRKEEADPSAVGALGKLKNQFTVINNMCRESEPSVCLHAISRLVERPMGRYR